MEIENYQCGYCHSIRGDIDKQSDGHPDIHFKLGGTTRRVKSYGDLVTSIINPDHRISGYLKLDVYVDEEDMSRMPSHDDVMTVQELIDLTTFLQSSYELMPPETVSIYYE